MILPTASDSERAVVSTLLVFGADSLREAQTLLDRDDFADPVYQTIWDACVEVDAADQTIDIVSASESLRATKRLDMIGGPHVLTNIACGASRAALATHLRTVKGASLRRQAIKRSERLQTDACDMTQPVVATIVQAGGDISALAAQLPGRYVEAAKYRAAQETRWAIAWELTKQDMASRSSSNTKERGSDGTDN